MKTRYRYCLLGLLMILSSGCARATPTESSFCVLAGDSWEDIGQVIELLDPFALQNGYERGERSPNGILYANKRVSPDWVLSVSPIGPIGVEISFYPREPDSFESEQSKVAKHVEDVIAEEMTVIDCNDRQDYGKGKIFGFDGIRL